MSAESRHVLGVFSVGLCMRQFSMPHHEVLAPISIFRHTYHHFARGTDAVFSNQHLVVASHTSDLWNGGRCAEGDIRYSGPMA